MNDTGHHFPVSPLRSKEAVCPRHAPRNVMQAVTSSARPLASPVLSRSLRFKRILGAALAGWARLPRRNGPAPASSVGPSSQLDPKSDGTTSHLVEYCSFPSHKTRASTYAIVLYSVLLVDQINWFVAYAVVVRPFKCNVTVSSDSHRGAYDHLFLPSQAWSSLMNGISWQTP